MAATLDQWLETGLGLLVEEGPGALTVARLCAAMGVTKGSFYHHFTSTQDFRGQLLQRWVELHTLRIQREVERSGDAQRALALLDRLAVEIDFAAEVAIRAWARWDPEVREQVAAVDRVRLDTLATLYAHHPAEEARVLAELDYCAYLGGQQLWPRRSDRRKVGRLLEEFRRRIQ